MYIINVELETGRLELTTEDMGYALWLVDALEADFEGNTVELEEVETCSIPYN